MHHSARASCSGPILILCWLQLLLLPDPYLCDSFVRRQGGGGRREGEGSREKREERREGIREKEEEKRRAWKFQCVHNIHEEFDTGEEGGRELKERAEEG